MRKRDLEWFLALQVFAVIWAGTVFGLIHNRLLAGALAGAYFVGSALVMLRWAWRWSNRWRAFCIYPLLAHLFGVAIPMLVMRFTHVDLPFSQIRIWGLPGPLFHQLSGWIFAALMVATVVDRIRVSPRWGRPATRSEA
jgi:hypothetical protein